MRNLWLGGSVAESYGRLGLVLLGVVLLIGMAIGGATCGLALYFLSHPAN